MSERECSKDYDPIIQEHSTAEKNNLVDLFYNDLDATLITPKTTSIPMPKLEKVSRVSTYLVA